MVRKTTKKKTTKKKTTAIANWDEELSKAAQETSKQEASASEGAKISVRGGVMSFGGAPFPENEMVAIVADFVLMNQFYTEAYDADAPNLTPDCYARGKNDKELVPYENSVDQQNETCQGCPQNAWGSGRGRGKACANKRRLAVLGAGAYDARNNVFEANEDPDELRLTPFAIYDVQVTSSKAWGQYVQMLAKIYNRPPYAVYTKIKLVPDENTVHRTTFEFVGKIPNKLLPAIVERNKEANKWLMEAGPDPDPEAKPAKKGKKKTTKKKTSKKRSGRKF
jgi:hypothetical protein